MGIYLWGDLWGLLAYMEHHGVADGRTKALFYAPMMLHATA
jgi:hypothetical protein